MADKKISALTGATTPLAGSEVLPIVQGGSTVKVSVDNLTAGKSVSATSFVPTGSTVPTNGMYLDAANSVSIANNSVKTATIRSGGIMGLGTTPQSWYLPGDVISAQQVGANTVTMSLFGNQSHFGSNFYLKTGTGNDTYINTGVAMRYRQDGGAHVFESAASGTADTNITFTPLATLNASGNLLVGASTTAGAASNVKFVTGGIFTTANGSAASTSGAAATLFAANGTDNEVYIVSAAVPGGAPALYVTVYLVTCGNGTLSATVLQSASNISISVSGLNVQSTQISGAPQNISWKALRVA